MSEGDKNNEIALEYSYVVYSRACQLYCIQRVNCLWAELARLPSPKDTSDGEHITTNVYTLLSKLTFMMFTCGIKCCEKDVQYTL